MTDKRPKYKTVKSSAKKYSHCVTVYVTRQMATDLARDAKANSITIAAVVREAIAARKEALPC